MYYNCEGQIVHLFGLCNILVFPTVCYMPVRNVVF